MSHHPKNKFRSKSIDKATPKNQHNKIEPKVHINILLENLSYNNIGFIIIEPDNEASLTLFNIRKNIKLQFDEDQLQLVGDADTFKFIMNKIPISIKQETLIHIKEIAISDQNALKLLQQKDKLVTIPGSDTSEDNEDNDDMYANKRSNKALSAPNTRHNSVDIQFDKMPHHYQYMGAMAATMGAMSGGSTNPSPSFLVIPTTPDIQRISNETKKDHKIRKKKRSNTSGFLSPFSLSPRNQNHTTTSTSTSTRKNNMKRNMKYYSVIIRSVETILPAANPSLFGTLSFPIHSAQTQDTDKDRDMSMSIFTRPLLTNITSITSINTEATGMDNMDSTCIESETDMSSNSDTSETSMHSQFSINDTHTKLEQRFGGKLPRIQTTRKLKSITHKIVPTDQITNILRNALVNNDQFKLKPMKSIRNMRNRNVYTSLDTKMNDSMSVIENIEHKNDMSLFDDRCRFTVIGSPMNYNNNNNNNNKNNINITPIKQRMWIFYDPSELILGLQGVHHSETNPVWMDIVCDEETFVMISEHVRPTIHTLTIEDCITSEGREKLELFDNYLFICIDTCIDVIDNNGNNGPNSKIYMIIFRHMIITYHKSRVSDCVITEARNRLDKRHKQLCPSDIGWVCHTIIDVIVDRMIPQIKCRVQEVQNVENLIFSLSGTSHHELLQRLQIARNYLIVYRSRLWTKSTMTYNLMQMYWRNKFLNGVQQQFWNDINDHVARMVDLLSLGQITLESAQNIFVAKLSLEMSEQSNALSDGASRLTAVGSIFLPLSFLSAVWGMNCKVPFQYEGPVEEDVEAIWSDDYYGFCIIFTCMIFIGIFTYRYHIKFS